MSYLTLRWLGKHLMVDGRGLTPEELTERLKDALALIDVRILDHFIVGDGEPLSMVEYGWM